MLVATETTDKFDVLVVNVRGGGTTGPGWCNHAEYLETLLQADPLITDD